MNCLIDIGNTLVKTATVTSNVISEPNVVENFTLSSLQSWCQQHDPENGIISSVKDIDPSVIEFLQSNLKFLVVLDSKTKIPLENLYNSPKTLGNDRIAAAVGANLLFPKTNVLIFDFGTAVTIDFVNSENQYLGGNISPGLQTRYKALHTFTGKLPLLNKSEKNDMLGKTTESAIISGVQNGMVYEIEGYINEFKSKYDDLNVIFTGGDAFFFEKKVKSSIFVESKLVLIGLNRILEYNAK